MNIVEDNWKDNAGRKFNILKRKMKPRLTGSFDAVPFKKVVKASIITLATCFGIKVLANNFLRRGRVKLLGSFMWLELSHNQSCPQLALLSTAEAWMKLMVVLWIGIGLYKVLTTEDWDYNEEKAKRDRQKLVMYRVGIALTACIIFAANAVHGLELFNILRYTLVIGLLYMSCIELNIRWLRSKWMTWGLMAIATGSAGNLIERFVTGRDGYVTDYMRFFPMLLQSKVYWNLDDFLCIGGVITVSVYVALQFKRMCSAPEKDEELVVEKIVRLLRPAKLWDPPESNESLLDDWDTQQSFNDKEENNWGWNDTEKENKESLENNLENVGSDGWGSFTNQYLSQDEEEQEILEFKENVRKLNEHINNMDKELEVMNNAVNKGR